MSGLHEEHNHQESHTDVVFHQFRSDVQSQLSPFLQMNFVDAVPGASR